jgi:hypothetical protein
VQLNINSLWGYTDLAWGNYVRPVEVSSGYTDEVVLRMTDNDEINLSYEHESVR